MTIIVCKSCKKEFRHFRHLFPKEYKLHCGFCGQEYKIIEDCHAPKLKMELVENESN